MLNERVTDGYRVRDCEDEWKRERKGGVRGELKNICWGTAFPALTEHRRRSLSVPLLTIEDRDRVEHFREFVPAWCRRRGDRGRCRRRCR